MILYEFVKSLSHFLFQKNDSSLYKGAFVGQPQGLFLRFNIFFNPCEAPASFHSSLFTLLCPSGLTTDTFSNQHSRRHLPRRPLGEASRFAYSFRRTQTLPILCRFCLRPCGILSLTGRGFGARHSRPPSPISDFLQARLFDRRLRPCPLVFALHIRISFQT